MTSLIDDGRIGEPARRAGPWLTPVRLVLLLLALLLVSQFFVVVPAGSRGVLLRFGAVQQRVLGEGLHPLLPGVESVRPLNVRVQSLSVRSEAASRDLQDVNGGGEPELAPAAGAGGGDLRAAGGGGGDRARRGGAGDR